MECAGFPTLRIRQGGDSVFFVDQSGVKPLQSKACLQLLPVLRILSEIREGDGMLIVLLGDNARQFKQRHEYSDNDSTNDNTEEDNQNRLKQ